VVVIGDVGSGKSSLLNAIIGDMIFLPQNEIDVFGGLEKLATVEEFELLNKRLLSRDLLVTPVVQIDGSMAYVE
jgi:GTPase SAR1 family protein